MYKHITACHKINTARETTNWKTTTYEIVSYVNNDVRYITTVQPYTNMPPVARCSRFPKRESRELGPQDDS